MYATQQDVTETSCNKVRVENLTFFFPRLICIPSELTLPQCEFTSPKLNYDKNVFFLPSNLGTELRSHDHKSFNFN